MRQGNDYEHRDALKGNVLFAIFYLGELAGYPDSSLSIPETPDQ